EVRSAVENGGHLRCNRQLDAVTLTERKRRAGRLHSFGDHLHAREDLGELPAACELDADVAVAAQFSRASQDEISQATQSGGCVTADPTPTPQPPAYLPYSP